MSVLIKGSIMPLMCEECPCYDCDDYSCKATGRGVIEYRYDGRPDNCPLVEIPTPHGRLIDADRLLESIKTNFYEHFGNYDSGQEFLFDLICSSIEDSLTIIEAEESK